MVGRRWRWMVGLGIGPPDAPDYAVHGGSHSGLTLSHPGIRMTMDGIAYVAVTGLSAVEQAVEKPCCRALYRGNTSRLHCGHGS